jgi:nicotinamidase-related amidase
MVTASAKPGKMLLSPTDHTLIMIDFQSQMAFATKSIDPVALRNNAALVANAARIFGVSFIPTTVAEKTFPDRCSMRSRPPFQRRNTSIAPA